jgi:uncharacterized circularly permuted ATP-grasp superfamily protein
MLSPFNEMGGRGDAPVRALYRGIEKWLAASDEAALRQHQASAEIAFRRLGITFAVYGEEAADERIIPFDIIPRLIAAREWEVIERGLIQRVGAINRFLSDLYGKREILAAGIIPEELIFTNPQFRLPMTRIRPPHDIWAHITGIDMVRIGPDDFRVLEDNARTPSGVSYMIENRDAMMRLFPTLFEEHRVRPVENYPDALLAMLRSVAPDGCGSDPSVVVMTPGVFNSAFYEHSFLADRIGVELVEGSDLFVRDDEVFMRTTQGPKKVDVIYRRVDDDFLDPLVFRPDSILGVSGLMGAYEAGKVTIVNAPGTGIADDKAIYTYMPDIIRFYTGEDAILANVDTWRCREPDALAYVLDHMEDLVVKLVDGSGGYGMLVGPAATRAEIEDFRARVVAEPQRYIAQPTLALSTCPTITDKGVEARHVDLRPFILTGANGTNVIPGGLTRVALREGSLVVNSSQGGGTKDSWVLEGDEPE